MIPNRQSDSENRKRILTPLILTVVFLALAVGSYALWLMTNEPGSYIALILSMLFALLLSLLLIRLIPFLTESFGADDSIPAITPARCGRKHRVVHSALFVAFTALLSRIVYPVILYVCSLRLNGYSEGFFEFFTSLNGPGIRSLLSLETNPDFIFASVYPCSPLYPAAIRALEPMIGSRFLSGYAVSTLFFVLACILLYWYCSREQGGQHAFSAVLFLCAFPSSFLFGFSGPYSMFLFMTLACFLAEKKRAHLVACFFGILSFLTSPVGILCMPFLLYEQLHLYVLKKSSDPTDRAVRFFIPNLICTFLVALPLLLFRVPEAVPGAIPFAPGTFRPFTFVYNNISSLTSDMIYLIRAGRPATSYVRSALDLLLIFLPIIVLLSAYRSIRPSLSLFGLSLTLLLVSAFGGTELAGIFFLSNAAMPIALSALFKNSRLRLPVIFLLFLISSGEIFLLVMNGGFLQ